MPIGFALRDLPGAIRELRERATAAGRDPQSIEVSLFWAPRRRGRAAGRSSDMGIARGILAVPSVGRDEVLPMLDQHAPLVDQLRA